MTHIDINGQRYKLLSRYNIGPHVYDEYLEFGGVMYDGKDVINIYTSERCPLCERLYTNTTRKLKTLCHNMVINHHYGYPVVICLDCRSYIEYIIDGDVRIIKSCKQLIDSGFQPKNMKKFLL